MVEFIRFALNQVSGIPEIVSDVESKLAKQLGEGGEIETVVELPPGNSYQIIRTYNGDDNPGEAINVKTGEVYKGDISALFPVMAYSQTEAIYIARNPQAQLELIDRFIDAPSFHRQINAVLDKLRRNDSKLTKVLDAKDELKEVKKEIKTVREEINNTEALLENPIFDEMKAAEDQKAGFQAELDYHDNLTSSLSDFIESLSDTHQPIDLDHGLAKNIGIAKANKASRAILKKLQSDLEASTNKITKNKDAVHEIFDDWLPQYEEIQTRYETFLNDAGGDQQRLAAKIRRLNRKKRELEDRANELLGQARRFSRISKERNELLDELDRLRQDFFKTRQQIFEELTTLSGGKLLLKIYKSANTGAFGEALKRIATGTRIRKKDLDQIAARISPRDFLDLVMNGDSETLAKESDIDIDNAEKLISWLKTLEAQDEVLAFQHQYLPDDVPSIHFKKEDGEYYNLVDLSVGQKCTALLIIALSAGKAPIIMDQPEEAIDIASVFSDIVSKLRSGKEKRQFIVTTHNPNIAVTADSDCIHILKSSASQGQIVHTGAIEDDKVRSEVIQHLEGGEGPFLLRGKKYGIIED